MFSLCWEKNFCSCGHTMLIGETQNQPESLTVAYTKALVALLCNTYQLLPT